VEPDADEARRLLQKASRLGVKEAQSALTKIAALCRKLRDIASKNAA